jgi:hypothetical protein
MNATIALDQLFVGMVVYVDRGFVCLQNLPSEFSSSIFLDGTQRLLSNGGVTDKCTVSLIVL